MSVQGLGRSVLAVIDLCSRRALQSPNIMVQHTSAFTLTVAIFAVGIGVMGYYRQHADFIAVMLLAITQLQRRAERLRGAP